MIDVLNVRHAYPEGANKFIDRPHGIDNYTFLHFFNSVELLLDGKVTLTKPHATLVYGMYTPQYYRTPVLMTHDWFHFTLTGEEMSSLAIRENVIYYPEYTDFITKIVREIEYEFFSNGTRSRELVDSKVRELFIKILRSASGEMEAPLDKETANIFRKLRGEVFLRLEESWSVDRMARLANLSPSRFYAVYKSVFHTSPTEDLIEARMEKAKNMLTSGTAPISEVAHEVGYVTLPHFTRLFTRHTGLSPRAYRERTRAKD